MTSTTILTLVDGVRIVVPNSTDLTTPYVIFEQQDWFEDEIKFLRNVLQPGQKVIDIGANYGVYTLSMARRVGPTGRVWSFEPASSTAKLLAEGIAANGFSHVVLERSALSSACGAAQLSLHGCPEDNALIHDPSAVGASETVAIVTLDECLERYGWRAIDFIKIDAEGEESNILKGGGRFFDELSPLVQYEVRAGQVQHLGLVQNFAALGYDSYRLVPGLDLLVPFDAGSTPDPFWLNLFCCKQDRVERLAADGFLLDRANRKVAKGAQEMLARTKSSGGYGWRQTLAKLPYGAQLADLWGQTMALGKSGVVDEALSLYALSRDPSQSASARFDALDASFSLLGTLCESDALHLRLASFARVAQAFGARSRAVDALHQLGNCIVQQNQVDPAEPFLAPGARFDSIAPGNDVGNWVLAAVLEETERLSSFSSYFTGATGLQRLEAIRNLGFGSTEMERRLQLLQARFGPATA